MISYATIPADTSPSWARQANCLGIAADLFISPQPSTINGAKNVCKGCITRDACLRYANEEQIGYGIWGGLAADERINAAAGEPPKPEGGHPSELSFRSISASHPTKEC